MNIKLGDKVKFLNEIGGGNVTKIINKETVSVYTSDGFEVPMLISELIKVENDTSFFPTQPDKEAKLQVIVDNEPEDENNDLEEELYYKETDDINIYYAFVPQNQKDRTNCDLDIYLVNDSNYYFTFNYLVKIEHLYQSKTGYLEPNTKEQIDTILRAKIGDLKNVVFQGLFYKSSLHDLKMPLHKDLKINPTRFFQEKSYKANDFFHEKSVIISVFEENDMAKALSSISQDDTQEIVVQKEIKNNHLNKAKNFQKQIKNLQIEVDLHIHELIEDEKGLSPQDILDIQMAQFRDSLERAINNPKVNKIIFIHGVGNGTLKLQLRSELETKYKKYKFQDASFLEYGYGATMVILKS